MPINSNQINIIFEISKIIITAVLTGLFTYWITFGKERKEKEYQIRKELIDKVYSPFIKMLNELCEPEDGYQGLFIDEVNEIINIINNNIQIVDPTLEGFSWSFKEDINYYSNYNTTLDDINFDNEMKFLNYVTYKYNYLRKKTYLPYDSSYFFFSKKHREFIQFKRKISRKIHKYFFKMKNKYNT